MIVALVVHPIIFDMGVAIDNEEIERDILFSC